MGAEEAQKVCISEHVPRFRCVRAFHNVETVATSNSHEARSDDQVVQSEMLAHEQANRLIDKALAFNSSPQRSMEHELFRRTRRLAPCTLDDDVDAVEELSHCQNTAGDVFQRETATAHASSAVYHENPSQKASTQPACKIDRGFSELKAQLRDLQQSCETEGSARVAEHSRLQERIRRLERRHSGDAPAQPSALQAYVATLRDVLDEEKFSLLHEKMIKEQSLRESYADFPSQKPCLLIEHRLQHMEHFLDGFVHLSNFDRASGDAKITGNAGEIPRHRRCPSSRRLQDCLDDVERSLREDFKRESCLRETDVTRLRELIIGETLARETHYSATKQLIQIESAERATQIDEIYAYLDERRGARRARDRMDERCADCAKFSIELEMLAGQMAKDRKLRDAQYAVLSERLDHVNHRRDGAAELASDAGSASRDLPNFAVAAAAAPSRVGRMPGSRPTSAGGRGPGARGELR